MYVFVKPASGWANATQTASDGLTDDSFGSVSISGDTIVAGALDHKVGANLDQGAVYMFVKPASGWKNATQTAELTVGRCRAGQPRRRSRDLGRHGGRQLCQ